MMSIGELSRQIGVHIETIRYYERVRVLPKPQRASNGRRVYRHEDAARLSYIRHARDLGFSLGSVRELLALQQTPNISCKTASVLASNQLADVEDRLRRLTSLRDELKRMVRACKNGRVVDCQVIEALARPK